MRNRRWFAELGVGVILALVASLLWGLDESAVSLPAVLRSLACGSGIFAAWLLRLGRELTATWVHPRHHPRISSVTKATSVASRWLGQEPLDRVDGCPHGDSTRPVH